MLRKSKIVSLTTLQDHNFHPAYRPDIDGLRAFAILSIVIFHTFPGLLPGGFVGVDVFFVISGFLISSIIFKSLLRGNFSFTEFYAHRVKRILPALLVVLAACYVFGWFTLLPDEFKQLGKHMAGSLGFVQNFVLWKEAGYFDTATELKPLMHLWSLAVEEQFYLVFPLLIWGAWRLGMNVLLVIVLLGLLSFGLNIAEVDKDAVKTFFLPQTRFWELMAGAALAYSYLFKRPRFSEWLKRRVSHAAVFRQVPTQIEYDAILNDLLSVFGLLFILAALFGLHKSNPFPGWRGLLPVCGSCLLIFSGPDTWVSRKILANQIAVFIGLISYPLYLWYWPLLSFAHILESGTPSPGVRLAAVTLGVFLAWVTYIFVEHPIRFGRKTWVKTAGLCALAAVACVTGYITFQSEGLEFRFPPDARTVANFKYDFRIDARVGTCWLSANQPPDGFAAECGWSDRSEFGKVAVWGDSYAARLYPGLRLYLKSEIAQFTRDSCPPITSFGYEGCPQSNEFVLSQIEKLHFDTVILFAVWNRLSADWKSSSVHTINLLSTVRRLSEMGVKNIIVLGPPPEWSANLPKFVFDEWRSRNFEGLPPVRIKRGFLKEARVADDGLKSLLYGTKAIFHSIIASQCDDDGCLVRPPDRPTSFFSWDNGHPTTEGAFFIARNLFAARAAACEAGRKRVLSPLRPCRVAQ
jgi:peptidoglycan/LPS O-acetylase OafA/YrhL